MVNYTPELKKAKSLVKEILVGEVMLKTYPYFKAHENVLDAVKILLNKKISGAPVIDEDKRAVGFLSEKDCLRIATEMKYYNAHPGKIADYMSKAVLSMQTNASIFDAIELFTKNSFHCYPVVEQKKVVGVIDRRTVLNIVNKFGQTTWYNKN